MPGTVLDRLLALYLKHYDRLHRHARRFAGTNSDADDLVQRAFLKAYYYMDDGKTIRDPRRFLYVTMRNLAINDYHRRKAQPIDSSVDVDQVMPDGDAPSVERQVMSEREFEGLCIAIGQLPERMRYALVLRKVYGYSYEEIAEQLGRSANTVREQVAQAFKKLQAHRNAEKEPNQEIGHTLRSSALPKTVPLRSRESSS